MPISSVSVGGRINASTMNAVITEANQIGTRLMIPTSATGGTVQTDGTVTFTAQSTIDVAGCFTSDYTDYEVEIVVPTTSTTLSVTVGLRDATTLLSSAVYDTVRITGNNSAVASAAALAATSFSVSAGNANGKHVITIHLFDVSTAAPTFGHTQAWSTPNPATAAGSFLDSKGLLYRNSDVVAGLRLTATAGTITGRVRVRGKN